MQTLIPGRRRLPKSTETARREGAVTPPRLGALLVWALGGLIAAAALTIHGVSIKRGTYYPSDEAALLVYPLRLLAGDVPHRDFETLYGPANIWLLAAVYKALWPSIIVERAVAVAVKVVAVLAMYSLGVSAGSVVAGVAAAGVMMVLLLGAGALALAWVTGIATAMLGFAVYACTPRVRVRCLGMSLIAAAALFRQDLALGIAPAVLVLVFTAPREQRRWLLAAASAPAVLMAVHVLWAGPGNAINAMLLDAMVASSGRRLPWPGSDEPVGIVLRLALVAYPLALVAGVVALVRRRQGLALALALFAAATAPQMLQRSDALHIYPVAVVVFAALPVLVAHCRRTGVHWIGPDARSPWHVVSDAIVLMAVIGALSAMPLGREAWHRLGDLSWIRSGMYTDLVVSDDRSLPNWRASPPQLTERALAAVRAHSSPGDRLFVGPSDLRYTNYNDTGLYYLLPEYEPATYHLEMNPLSANRQGTRLTAELRRADVLILDDAFLGWDEPNASKEPGDPRPNAVVKRLFCERWSEGPLTVLTRC